MYAQDVIIKRSGGEIIAKVTEVDEIEVKYKKFANLDGPTYTISKQLISVIIYENGTRDTFVIESEPSESIQYVRKGLHLGGHITPGMGAMTYDMDHNAEFGLNFGADINYYFNDFVGLKTGFSYLYLPIGRNDDQYNAGNISSVGIPLKFVITTGSKIGLYLESGMTMYFPFSSSVDTRNGMKNDFHDKVMFVGESVLGGNMMVFERMSINLGMSWHYTFFDVRYTSTSAVLMGFQFGMLFNMSK